MEGMRSLGSFSGSPIVTQPAGGSLHGGSGYVQYVSRVQRLDGTEPQSERAEQLYRYR